VAVITFVGFPSQRRKTLPAIAAIALGALIVVLAPGNAVRAAHFRREMSLGIFALIAVDAVTFLWPEFTQATSALALVFILAAMAGMSSTEPATRTERASVMRLAVALLWSVFAPFLLARIVMSAPAPLRSLQATHAALTVGSAFCGWAIAGLAMQRIRASIVLCATAVVLTGLQIGAISDMRTTAISATAFARGWDRMDADLRALRGKSFVVIPAPRTVGDLDFLTPWPGHWANRCVADYYGVGSAAGRAP